MKKSIYAALAAFALLPAMNSCSNDLENFVTGEENVDVTITASIANALSRAVGDGSSVDQITYAVYKTNADNTAGDVLSILDSDSKSQKTETMSGGTYTLNLTLVRGEVYTVVFWADKAPGASETSPYTFDATNKKVTVSYDGAKTSDDTRDAFFGSVVLTAGSDLTPSVELTRPFSLINLCATDVEAYKTASSSESGPSQSYITVVGAATTFNFFGDPADSTTASFALSAVPTTDSPVTDASYLGYTLVLPASSTADVTYGVKEGTAMNTISGIPVKANYQTNIQGGLLTSGTAITAALAPAYVGTESYDIWDGTTVTTPDIDDENKEITVGSASDFMGLLDLLNGTSGGNNAPRSRSTDTDYSSYNVKLEGDFDFNGKEISMVGNATRSGSTASGKLYTGVFDGQGHTIRNFVIKHSTSGENKAAIGLIACLSGKDAVLKNVNFSDIEISSTVSEQVGLIGLIADGATVENVNVLSGSISSTIESVGGIAGRVLKNGTIKNCTNAATVVGCKNVGGIVGAAYYNETNYNMVIDGCTNSGSVTINSSNAVGGIVGLSCATVKNCTNTGAILNTGSGESVGGIVGEQNSAGSVSDCVNSGSVTTNASKYGTGGIVGWIRYSGDESAYPVKNKIVVSGCENSADITSAGTGAGGIVGVVYHWATVENCKNSASKIKAGQWASGIVGGYQATTDAHPGVTTEISSFGAYLLTLTSNTTTTTAANLDSSLGSTLRGLLVYDNTSGSNVTYSGNSPESNQISE
jgi:hypothetical protein